MSKIKDCNSFQVVRSVLYRDGLENTCRPQVFRTYGEAMSTLARLDSKAQPFEHYSIRGTRTEYPLSLPRGLEDYKPHLRDKRPVKAYAVQVSAYDQGREPEGYSGPWFDAWGRNKHEARFNYLSRYGGRRPPKICAVVELDLEQEKAIKAAGSEEEARKLAGRYGPEALSHEGEEVKRQ